MKLQASLWNAFVNIMLKISNNSTVNNCEYSVEIKSALCTLLSLTSLLSLVENSLLCAIVRYNKKLHKRSQVLIVSLSITDIIIALLLPPFEFGHILLYPRFPFGKFGSIFTRSIWMFSIVQPSTTAFMIACERYLVLSRNRLYLEHCTKRTLALVIASMWLYSIVWVLVIAFNLTYTSQDLVSPLLYYAYLGIHVGIPILVIPLIYIRIYMHVMRSREHVLETSGTTIPMSMEIRLAKTMGIIISLLFLIWLPLLVIEGLRSHDFDVCIIKKIDSFNVWLTCLNGCLDPLIYSFRSSDVKESLKALKKHVKDRYKSSYCFYSTTLNNESQPLLDGLIDWTTIPTMYQISYSVVLITYIEANNFDFLNLHESSIPVCFGYIFISSLIKACTKVSKFMSHKPNLVL